MLAVPPASELVVMESFVSTVRLSAAVDFVCWKAPPESVAVTTILLDVPAAVGVPVIWMLWPVVALSANPAGNPATVQWIVPVPPVAVMAAEVYALF